MLDKAEGAFRRWFAKVWKVRGGGLYAVGFALTFIYLEVTTIAGEFIEADSIGAFISDQLLEFVLRFAVDSLINTLHALMWPLHVVQWRPPVGAILLGLAFWIFPTWFKKPINDWLFPETEQEPPA